MRFKNIPYDRVNIKISKKLALKLEEKAVAELLTKSELIRNWIKEDCTLHVKRAFESSKGSVSLNFRIDLPTLKKLKKACKFYEVSKSTYIRLLILNKLSPIQNKCEIVPANILSKENDYYEIKRYLDNKDDISNSELTTLLDANTRLGLFDDAMKIFSIYEDRKYKSSLSEDTILDIELSKVRIDLSLKFDSGLIATLEELSAKALALQYRRALGEVNILKGEFFRNDSRIDMSSLFYEKALEYLDVINYPNEVSEVYIRLATYHLYQSNHLLARKFLHKSSSILKQTGNKIQASHYTNVKSFYYCFSNLDKSIHYVTKELHLDKQIKFTRGQIFAAENLVRFFIFKKDFNSAYKYLEFAISKLKFVQIDFDFIRLKLCKLFIVSFTHYAEAVKELNILKLDRTKVLRSLRCEYILNAIKYINGKTFFDRYSAEMSLKRIVSEGPYALLQKAAQYTLENKNLYLYF